MAESKVRRYSLREEKRRIARENPPIQIDLDDDDIQENAAVDGKGKVIAPTTVIMEVPAAVTWNDEVLELSKKDPVGAAKMLVGDDKIYARFVAQGGSAQMLFVIAGQQDQGADAGE
jgi:hypothetical protein